MRPFPILSSVLSVVVVAGCGSGLTVSDRSDFGTEKESVRAYCSGALVELRLSSSNPFIDDQKVEGTSSDEEIFTVESSEDGLITLRTIKAGKAELVLKQDGDVVDSRPLQVRDPARITLSLDIKAFEEDDIVPESVVAEPPLRVLVGRNARLAVHVFAADDKELFGQSVTGVAPVDTAGWNAGLLFDGPQSFIELAPKPGALDTLVQVNVGGLLNVDVEAIASLETELERIVLDEVNPGYRPQGRRSVVLARGEDAQGRLLLGAPGWALEGSDGGIGEAVAYDVKWFESHELVARIGDVEARRQVDADPETLGVVRVGDSCASAGFGLPLVLLGLLRRRRG
ncbi:MAG: hypothetical protein Q8O67_05220 [Deltaproteobacteria bacterium]|nr:hypothetical protein [Deltaproteobacteria bacterium]